VSDFAENSINDMQLFMIEEGDMVVAVVSWKITNTETNGSPAMGFCAGL
jgi:hypothetical protein